MQFNSTELFLKVTKMRDLVGDAIPGRTLEAFLKATKGDLDAAVDIYPHKFLILNNI